MNCEKGQPAAHSYRQASPLLLFRAGTPFTRMDTERGQGNFSLQYQVEGEDV